jgi:hypothetical protein
MIKSLGLTRLLTIHDFIPYESLTARIDIGSTPGMVQYKLFPYGESTLLEQTLAIVPFGALKLLSVLLRASMKMEFDSLKRWVENEHRMLRSPDALI